MEASAIQRLWRGCVVRISLAQIIVAGGLLYVADLVFDRVIADNSSAWPGVFDDTAHVATALLILNLLPLAWRRAILLPALIGSFAIDVDHVPQYFLGTRFLTEGTPRPYTHSWVTPAALLVAALLIPRWRVFLFGLAVGVLLHLFRDLAESSGAGISAFWPFTDHVFRFSHGLYLVLMAVVLAANLVRLGLVRQPQRAMVPG